MCDPHRLGTLHQSCLGRAFNPLWHPGFPFRHSLSHRPFQCASDHSASAPPTTVRLRPTPVRLRPQRLRASDPSAPPTTRRTPSTPTTLLPTPKKNKQIGHHARLRRASATAPLRTGADMFKTGSGAGKCSGAKPNTVRRRSNHAWTEEQEKACLHRRGRGLAGADRRRHPKQERCNKIQTPQLHVPRGHTAEGSCRNQTTHPVVAFVTLDS